MLSQRIKHHEKIESALLEALSYPYLLFSKEGKLVQAHSEVQKILMSLSLGENEMRYKNALIAGLAACIMSDVELLKYYLESQLKHPNDASVLFSQIVEQNGSVYFIQCIETPLGSYAFFQDFKQFYGLYHRTNMLNIQAKKIKKVILKSAQHKKYIQDNTPLYSMAGNTSS